MKISNPVVWRTTVLYNVRVDNPQKALAIKLRRKGHSIRTIEKKLRVSRSTLSSWFKDIILTELQQERLLERWHEGLVHARAKAALWHNDQKAKRLLQSASDAKDVLDCIDTQNENLLDLALALLYLGEGFKKIDDTGMGNTDPLVLKTFLVLMRKIYKIPDSAIRCQLHLRADQSSLAMKKFWSRALGIPTKNFTFVYKDKRTSGSKTYPDYHGVCSIRCGNVAIKRKLINLSRGFCEKIIE